MGISLENPANFFQASHFAETVVYRQNGLVEMDHALAAHRYWRVYITASTAGASMLVSAYEVEMRATVGGADQCSGGTASASHEDANAYKLFDNATTYWVNGSPSEDTWFQYDFGSGNDAAVAELSITPRYDSQAPEDFSLQYSDNGTDFTDANAWTGVTDWIGGVEKLFEIPALPPNVDVDVVGIFDMAYTQLEPGGSDELCIESFSPTLLMPASVVDGVSHADAFVVRGVEYRVVEVQPDGTGLVLIVLEVL